MTPELSAVYDELVARASASPHEEESSRQRKGYLERIGWLGEEHPSAVGRTLASWEHLLVRGRLAATLGDTLEDEAERACARGFLRARQGCFSLERRAQRTLLHDRWAGGTFLLSTRDDLARAMPTEMDLASAVFLGRILGIEDGATILPGLIWLPSEAVPLLEPILREARQRELSVEGVTEALLRMDARFLAMSRGKASFAFRPERLDG